MNKIFQIGFNKCATISFFDFFASNALPISKCTHWDDGKLANTMRINFNKKIPLLHGYEHLIFFSDMEAYYLEGDEYKWIFAHIDYYKLLDQQYPNSKFILNIRSKDKWLNSRKNHFMQIGNKCYSYWDILSEIFNMSKDKMLEKWSQDWDNHIQDVLFYFAERPKDLLVYNIEKDEGQKIVDFFKDDLYFTENKFPHSFLSKDRKVNYNLLLKSLKNN